MNERIEELMDQAREHYRNKDLPHEQGLIAYSEKFAELIVKECGQHLMRDEFIGRSDLDWSMILNEHFGVEE